MQIDLKQLDSDDVRFDIAVDFGPLPLAAGESVELLDGRLAGHASRGGHGVDFSGKLQGRVRLACSRCLQPCESPLDVDFRLILVPELVETTQDDVELDDRASLFFVAEGGKAELAEIAREQIYLNLPLKPVCEAGCKGLCATCGANRNRLECGCRTEEPDPRLASLLELKKKMEQR